MSNRGFAAILIIGFIAVVFAAGGYWYWQNQRNQEAEVDPISTVIPTNTLTETPITTPIQNKSEADILREKVLEQIEISRDEVTIFNTYDVEFDSIKVSESGDWGKAVVFYKDKQTGEVIPTEGDLILAKKVSSNWQVLIGLTHSSEWDQWVQDAPADIVPSGSKEYWAARYAETDQVDTSKWQEYQNTSTSVSFQYKYPPGYLMNDEKFEIVDPAYDGIHEINIYGPDIGAQGPGIKVSIYNYEKTVDQFIEETRSSDTANWETFTSEMGYEDFEPIGIKSVDDASNSVIQAKKIYRLNYPNAPDREETQYLFKVDQYLVVLSATYGSYNPNNGRDGTEERDYLDGIFQTFETL